VAAAQGIRAEPASDRLVLESNGTSIEVSAPRDDIFRVRLSRGRIPEDASWAVRTETRASRLALKVSRTETMVRVEIPGAMLQIDRSTLGVSFYDKAGQLLLKDSANAVRFSERAFELTKDLAPDAHIFGLGDKTGSMDRRGQFYTLWNTDAYGFDEATDPIYKSIPFFILSTESGGHCGLFLDNTFRSHFDFGKRNPDRLDISADGGSPDYYLFAGKDPKSVVSAYTWLTGTAPLAPLWSLGFQQSHYSYPTAQAALAIADHLRADSLPADVLYLDIDYQDRNRPFTVDTRAFPDLKQLVADLKQRHFELVLITDLHIAYAPSENYAPYDSGKAADVFLKNPDGSDYIGNVWPGKSVFPDFSRSTVRDWWGRQYAQFAALGVGGFWNDMNEPSIFDTPSLTMPLDTQHRIEEPGFSSRNATHAEMHNVYGMLNSRATFEGLSKLVPDRRPFVLTRATYAGGQRYAATWTGDNTSSYQHLQLASQMLANLGASGFCYVGDDIGGFTGPNPSAELLTRWIEVGAFNPIFRDHSDKSKAPQEPWVDGAEQESIRRRYIETRYRLLPYIYQAAETCSRTGVPMLRSVFLDFPELLKSHHKFDGRDGQFMFGDALMVAPPPVWESPAPYEVVLPRAGWFDFWSGERLQGNRVKETPVLDRLPVFVKPGSILPQQPLVQSTAELPQGPLQLSIYPGPDASGSLYADDGVSLAYQHGAYFRQAVRYEAGRGSARLTLERADGTFSPWWSSLHVVIHGYREGQARVEVAHGRVNAVFDAETCTLSFELPGQNKGLTVVEIRPEAAPRH
jgi:alpha-glucosidase